MPTCQPTEYHGVGVPDTDTSLLRTDSGALRGWRDHEISGPTQAQTNGPWTVSGRDLYPQLEARQKLNYRLCFAYTKIGSLKLQCIQLFIYSTEGTFQDR
jgi:hypothetical protein